MKLTSHPKLVLATAIALALALNLSGLRFSFEPECVKFSEPLERGILTKYALEVLEAAVSPEGNKSFQGEGDLFNLTPFIPLSFEGEGLSPSLKQR